jgi:hypothetical protein
MGLEVYTAMKVVGTLSPHMGSQPRGYVSLHKAGETKVVLSLNTEYHLGKE